MERTAIFLPRRTRSNRR